MNTKEKTTMSLFLTSTLGSSEERNGFKASYRLNKQNFFTDRLHEVWKEPYRILLFSGDPVAYRKNDNQRKELANALSLENLSVSDIVTYDERNFSDLTLLIKKVDVVFIMDGNNDVQKGFMSKCRLRTKLKNFHGILITAGSGTVNIVEVVQNSWVSRLTILPQQLENVLVSTQRELLLPNGSYYFEHDGKGQFYGDVFYRKDGNLIELTDEERGGCINTLS